MDAFKHLWDCVISQVPLTALAPQARVSWRSWCSLDTKWTGGWPAPAQPNGGLITDNDFQISIKTFFTIFYIQAHILQRGKTGSGIIFVCPVSM